MDDEETIRRRFELLGPHLDERTRRLTAAAEAEAIVTPRSAPSGPGRRFRAA